MQEALGVLGADVRRQRVAHAAEPVGERAVAVERDPVGSCAKFYRVFDGFGQEAFAWFEGLERDNSREYFTRTRDLYEREVRGRDGGDVRG